MGLGAWGLERSRACLLLTRPASPQAPKPSSPRQPKQACRDDLEHNPGGAARDALRAAVEEALLKPSLIDGSRVAGQQLCKRSLSGQCRLVQVLRQARPELLLQARIAAG